MRDGVKLDEHPIHLGRDATAEIEPVFTGGLDWYAAYAERHRGDGADARLVNIHTFSESWPVWEMHPKGSEVVLCLSGSMILRQRQAGEPAEVTIALHAGEYAINPPGIWHTADVSSEATALFITAGSDTEHQPR